MDNREILTRFKNGTLDRKEAAALLADAFVPAPARDTSPPGPVDPTVKSGGETDPTGESGGDEPAPVRAAAEPALPVAGTGACAARQESAAAPDAYAVIGIAGRYPGANGPDELWQQIRDGHDPVEQVPRSPIGRPETGAHSGAGHLLDRIAEFDPEFFAVTAEEAALMDPQERLFLETAWETVEQAGCVGPRLDRLTAADGTPRSLGVYVGVSSADYALLAAELWAQGRRVMPRSGHWSLPSRFSALLRLTGPSRPVDSEDASFLVALDQAVAALRAGECAAALVGAVELRLHAARQRQSAAECVGAVLLKPLLAAEADGDAIHAVVRASAVGRRRDLDHSDSARLLRTAARAAGVDVGSLTVHEDERSAARPVGEAGAATGFVALTRAVLQLREATLAPAPDAAGPDHPVPWSPPRQDGGGTVPRRASVGVTGAGGDEAVVIVEECPARADPRAGAVAAGGPADAEQNTWAGPNDDAAADGAGDARVAGSDEEDEELVLLSAPTLPHLLAGAERLAAWLRATDGTADLGSIAAELRAGRAVMRCRLATRVRGIGQLADALDAFVRHRGDAGPGPETGDVAAAETVRWSTVPHGGDELLLDGLRETEDYVAALWRGGCLEQLARLWLAGVDIAAAAPPQYLRHRAELPGSALIRRTLWLGRERPQESAAA